MKTEPTDTTALLRFAELAVKAGHAGIACETYARAGDGFAREGSVPLAISAYTNALNVAREGELLDGVVSSARTMAKLYAGERLVRDAASMLDSAAGWLIERGFDREALRLLEDRMALDDSGLARVRLAETHLRLREHAKGVEQLTLAYRRLQAQGRRDEALDVAERLMGERPDVAIARACAEMYLDRNRAGDPFLALAKLRICCDSDAAHIPTLELLARAFDLAGHTDKATRVRREIALASHKAASPAAKPRTSPPLRPSVVPARPSVAAPAAPPRLSAIRPKALPIEEPGEKPTEDSIECFWDDLVVESDPTPRHIDPSHPSFWPADTSATAEDEGKVMSVSLSDVELLDGPPSSVESAPSVLETALECIESLCAQSRYEEAALLVVRNLTIRPRNRLLLEKRAEIEVQLEAQAEEAEAQLGASAVVGARVRSVRAS